MPHLHKDKAQLRDDVETLRHQILALSADSPGDRDRLLIGFARIGQVLMASLDLNDVLDALAELIPAAGGFRSLTISLVDHDMQQVEVVRGYMVKDKQIMRQGSEGGVGMRYRLNDAHLIIPRTVHTGDVQIVESPDDPRLDVLDEAAKEQWRKKVAYFIPIKNQGNVVAVLATASTRAERDDMVRRIGFMQPLLDQVALALNHARLQQKLNDQVQRQTALLTINAVIQKMERADDLASVIQIIYDQLKRCGVDFVGMAIRRFLDEEGLTQRFSITPKGQLECETDFQPEIYASWKKGEVLYRPNVEHDLQGLHDGYFEKTYSSYGISVRSLLTVSYNQGTLVLRSEKDHAFSKDDVEFVRQIVEVLSLAMTRVLDMERMETQNRALEESERRLTEQFQELESVYRYTPVGLFMMDCHWRLLRFNQRLAELYDLQESDLGRSLHDVMPDPMEDQKRAFEQVAQTGIPVMNVEASGLSPVHSDRENTWLISYYPLKSSDGHVDRILGAVLDVTVQKQMEQERIRTQRLRALGEMAAGVSHNLNNILTGVIGPAQLAQTMISDEEAQVELESIITSGLRAKELVSRLSRGLIGERDVLCPVDINAVVQEAILASRPRWKDEQEAAGIAIHVETDLVEAPHIKGTQTGLHDMLLNLIFNAVDAMPEGGRIEIQTRLMAEKVRLTFCDTGIGMDAPTVARVFDPFFTTKANVGSGLGLSTVYGTINRWGGHIAVDSAPGQGTRFMLDFLAYPAEDAPPSDLPPSFDH